MTSKLALVMGSSREEVQAVLSAFNIEQSFDCIVTADDVQNVKPDPEGYVKGADLLGCSLDECIVIEDSPSGVGVANAAGIKSIALTTTHTANELSEATKIIIPPLKISDIV